MVVQRVVYDVPNRGAREAGLPLRVGPVMWPALPEVKNLRLGLDEKLRRYGTNKG